MRTTLAALAATALLLAGCGSDEEPAAEPTSSPSAAESPSAEASQDDAVTVDVEIADGEVTPRGERVEVAVGQDIRLRVTADAEDEVHVHADPEVSLFTKPGETVEKTFAIERPGQVAVESHGLGATIVQLVVR